MNFSFWVHKYSGHEEEEDKGGVDKGQVQGVHIQEWVHVCGHFARNSLIDVVFHHLFKSPDVHGHGVALAVVEEVEGEDVAEWVHSYYGMGLGQHFHHKIRDVGQVYMKPL